MKILQKIILIISIFILSTLGLLIFDAINTSANIKNINYENELGNNQQEIADMIQKSLLEMRYILGDMLFTERLNQIELFHSKIVTINDDINRFIDVLNNGGTIDYYLRTNNEKINSIKHTVQDKKEIDIIQMELKTSLAEITEAALDIKNLIIQKLQLIESGDNEKLRIISQKIQRIAIQMTPVFLRAIEKSNEIYKKSIENHISAQIKIHNNTKKTFRLKLFFTLFILAGAVLIVVFIALGITKNVNKIVQITDKMSMGDYTIVLDHNLLTLKDEVGILARSYQTMISNTINLLHLIRNQSDKTNNLGCTLSTNMTETVAAVNEISANIQSIRNQANNQSESVNKTTEAMKNISLSINTLNQLIDNQSSNVSVSSSAIEEMIANISSVTQTLVNNTENIKKLTQSSESGRIDLTKITKDIKEVARESESLFEISHVIQNIASQTNLLSMNASIEAAHAGESGKGFSVVATEVRKLAESSEKQAKTVADVLKRIKTAIDEITRSTEGVLNKITIIESEVKIVSEQENIIRNAMEEQHSGSKQVLQAISELNDITEKVKNGSENIISGNCRIMEETENLSKITYEITNGIQEIAIGTQEVTTAVTMVNELTEDNRISIKTLINEVEKFRI